ncbi:MAG TPA: C25 family cysteine peptidase [Anaerolineae bacterium]|nr:C25 family cysteine peptidase [Anaerolineae bacterium]
MESLSRRLGKRFCILHRAIFPALVAGTVLLALCLPSSSAVGGLPASAAQQPQQDAPRVDVVDSSTQGLTLDVTVPAVIEQQVQHQATTFQRLSLLGAGSTSEIGQPELPSFGRFVAIPKGAQLQVQVLADQLETRSGYLLYPAQEPRVEQGEEPPFTLDAASYQRDEFLPSEIATVEGPYSIRGVEVILVRFHPVQYNPAGRTLRIHTSFRTSLSFSGGGSMLPDERLRSPYFEPLLASTLLNYAELEPPQSFGSSLAGATGCDYLIITAPHLVNQANLLADWKIRRGINTCVRTTGQTGSTASSIKSYIQNAYDTWNPAPSFVLFLGDAEFIPTNYVTEHPDQLPKGSLIGTDLYYATVDGTDYFPDLSTGRISVDTASQALKIINKIINYERNPPYTASFYTNVALAAYFQDENLPYDREDRDWVRTSEEIGSYLGSIGYDERRIYYAEPWVNPLFYNDGTPLPFYLWRDNYFPWIGNTAEIVNWVNSGTLILNHRDHGWRMMWAIPELQVSHVQALINGSKLPVVFSMNCETGWFDNETDDWRHGTDYYEVTFAEAWQRNQNGGAAGIVAPTRISYGGYNDFLDKGLIDAIWPGFLPYTPSPGAFASPQCRMGQVLNYAKLYMATLYGEGTYRKITFEMFHYFGDPTMEIWTAEPSSMAVSHTPIYYAGPTPYTVGVEDGALVSLVRDGKILATAISAGGTATFTELASLTPGTVYLTVTKHNHRPYESAVLVLTEGMVPRAYLPLASR